MPHCRTRVQTDRLRQENQPHILAHLVALPTSDRFATKRAKILPPHEAMLIKSCGLLLTKRNHCLFLDTNRPNGSREKIHNFRRTSQNT